MCSQEVRRKNAPGVNLLIFNITNLFFLIRFLRFFRISRIFPTSKFSKYSKDSNLSLITPTYFPDTIPKGYRTDTEGISMSPLMTKKYFATLFMSSEVFP